MEVSYPVVALPTTVESAGSSVTPLATAPVYPAGNKTTSGFAIAKGTGSGSAPKTTLVVVPVPAPASGAERFGGSIFAAVVAAVGALVLL